MARSLREEAFGPKRLVGSVRIEMRVDICSVEDRLVSSAWTDSRRAVRSAMSSSSSSVGALGLGSSAGGAAAAAAGVVSTSIASPSDMVKVIYVLLVCLVRGCCCNERLLQ